MARSSLGTLSPPSSSPSPIPEESKATDSNNNNNNAAMDADSELSELTEEEQQGGKKRGPDSKSSRGSKPARRGRKKRSSLVPAPMWGWVGTKASGGEEEEEPEESTGAPKPMEEEEPEDEREPRDIVMDDLDAASLLLHASATNGQLSDDDEDMEERDELENDQSEDEDEPPATSLITPVKSLALGALADGNIDSDSDGEETAYTNTLARTVPPTTSPILPAAASLMATTEVIHPRSASASASSSPSSSRSNSPQPDADILPNDEVAESGSSGTRVDPRPRVIKTGTTGDTPALEAAEVLAGLTNSRVSDVQEGARDVVLDDAEGASDLENELESELQPAHRAEALDVLAVIELNFAMLRERLYVEKMEALAWEEGLINDGSHPELLHFQEELSKRRDKRIELATRKRALASANISKKRRLDEDGTWSWWKLSRDGLQTDMISETNRKRRRLERDRRAVERPQPLRRFPTVPLEVPVPPTLRQIVSSFAYGDPSIEGEVDAETVYPDLTTLSSADITDDLNWMLAHRQHGTDIHRVGNDISGHGPVYVLPPGADTYHNPRTPAPAPSYPHSQSGNAGIPPSQPPVPGYIPYPTGGSAGGRHSRAVNAAIVGPDTHHHAHAHPPLFAEMEGMSPGGSQFLSHDMGFRRSPPPVNPRGMKGDGHWSPAVGPPTSMSKTELARPMDWPGDSRGHGDVGPPRDRDRVMKERDEHPELDRHREHQHMQLPPQHPSHRHPSHAAHQHRGAAAPHHHHHHHHHHPTPNGAIRSPHAIRDHDKHIPLPQHPTEMINLSSSSSKGAQWKGEDGINLREGRSKHPSRPASGAANIAVDERDRPPSLPFTMGGGSHARSLPTTPGVMISNNSGAPWGAIDEPYPPRLPSPGPPGRYGPPGHAGAYPPPGQSLARSPKRHREREGQPLPRARSPIGPGGSFGPPGPSSIEMPFLTGPGRIGLEGKGVGKGEMVRLRSPGPGPSRTMVSNGHDRERAMSSTDGPPLSPSNSRLPKGGHGGKAGIAQMVDG